MKAVTGNHKHYTISFSILLHFHAEKPKLVPITFGQDVLDEGEYAQLLCTVSKGDEPLTITWSLKGDRITSGPTLTTTSLGTRTSMLTISSVGYRHSGTYTCKAKNQAGYVTASAELKVNGNYRFTHGRRVENMET